MVISDQYMKKEDHIFAYSRSYGCQKLVLICNFSSKEKILNYQKTMKMLYL